MKKSGSNISINIKYKSHVKKMEKMNARQK